MVFVRRWSNSFTNNIEMIDSLVFFPVSIFSDINYVFIDSHRIRIRSDLALIMRRKVAIVLNRSNRNVESIPLGVDSFSFYILPVGHSPA